MKVREGDDEGLTAIGPFESFGTCTVRGNIIEGDVPPAPEPHTAP